MNVGFFAFGSGRIGMGHVVRCLNLAALVREQRPEAKIWFELGEHPEAVSLVEQRMPEAFCRCWPEDRIPEGNWDVLVVDRLRMVPEVMVDLKRRCLCLVSIDDNGAGRWQADIAVNPLYAPVAPRPDGNQTVNLVGIAHSLVQPAFAGRPVRMAAAPTALLLAQGAGDPHGLLPSLVGALTPVLRARPAVTLHVLTGSSFAGDAALDAALDAAGVVFRRHRSVSDPAELMVGIDLAVTSIGVTACELACLGVPLVMVTGEAKEVETAAMLEQAGAGVSLGLFSSGRSADLARLCAVLLDNPDRLRAMGELGRRAVDGHAATRIMRMAVDLAESRKQRENGW